MKELERPTREKEQRALFELEPDWRQEWWGMPEFEMKDASPQRSITINFLTESDIKEFQRLTGIYLAGRKTDSAWFPPQQRLQSGVWEYAGPKTNSRYPICIPSKGRWDYQKTAKALDGMGVSYRVFVEETEAENYIQALGAEKVVIMPFHDLGQGSIPARNFIWEWAKEKGYKRHWVIDDNIIAFRRCNINRRLKVSGGAFFQAMEDFVDRYENIAFAGPHHQGFVQDRECNFGPYHLNVRVYSCILIDTSLPYRWRGRYNEDTDISLRALKDGYCTMLFRALLMHKSATAGSYNMKNKPVPGGNTDTVYDTTDYRLQFAKDLEAQHPDCVKVVWKYDRWHHQVDYSMFKQKLIRKPGITPVPVNNEYGMRLIKKIENNEI